MNTTTETYRTDPGQRSDNSGLPFGVLNQKHPEYCGDVWRDLGLLYVGGWRVQEKAKHFLPQLEGERAGAYRNRLMSCTYINYLGQIVDYFAAALFQEPLMVTSAADAADTTSPGSEVDSKYWGLFGADCDLRGTPISQFVRQCFAEAILKRCTYVGIDFPQTPETSVRNRADEDAIGAARAYLVSIPPEEMIDYGYEDEDTDVVVASPELADGQMYSKGYSFVVLRRCIRVRGTPEDQRGTARIEFKVWRKNPDGTVTWELFRTKTFDGNAVQNPDDAFKPDDIIEQVVPPQETSFTRIPILELEVPDGLWVGNKIGPLAIEHWQRRSALVASENRSLLAIGYVKLGDQMSAPGGPVPADVAQDQNRASDANIKESIRSKGFLALSKDDEVGFAEPSGTAWKITDEQLENLIREMHRTVHQMAMSVNNNSSALVRSGISKQEDRLATGVIMSAYADIVRVFAKGLYQTVSEARKEDVIWTVHGLDDYERPDRMQLLQEAVQEDTIQIPSPTYKKLRKYELALGMLSTRPSPETRMQIKRELDEGVEAEIEMQEALKQTNLEQQQQPPEKPAPPGGATPITPDDEEPE